MFADIRALALSQHSPLNPAQPHKLTFRSSNFYAVCTVIQRMFNYKYFYQRKVKKTPMCVICIQLLAICETLKLYLRFQEKDFNLLNNENDSIKHQKV